MILFLISITILQEIDTGPGQHAVPCEISFGAEGIQEFTIGSNLVDLLDLDYDITINNIILHGEYEREFEVDYCSRPDFYEYRLILMFDDNWQLNSISTTSPFWDRGQAMVGMTLEELRSHYPSGELVQDSDHPRRWLFILPDTGIRRTFIFVEDCNENSPHCPEGDSVTRTFLLSRAASEN
ncbi:MAG: hypothetical protein DHS20C06_16390 [Hyphobacterium sp.]|nr:MAG: hypothetical protein DHS20C06_16390 [Hyphobacterium sp.]